MREDKRYTLPAQMVVNSEALELTDELALFVVTDGFSSVVEREMLKTEQFMPERRSIIDLPEELLSVIYITSLDGHEFIRGKGAIGVKVAKNAWIIVIREIYQRSAKRMLMTPLDLVNLNVEFEVLFVNPMQYIP